MTQFERSLQFFRVWAILETTALTFTLIGIFGDSPLYIAVAGGMFFCITIIGIWMKVVRPMVVLSAAVLLSIAAIFVDEPWYYGTVSAVALLVLANMPQNLMLLVSRDPAVARQIARLLRRDGQNHGQ